MIIILRKKSAIFLIFILITLLSLASLRYYFRTKPIVSNIDGYIAIIIDDFGNYSEGTDKLFSLKIPFTAAIIPNMPSSKEDVLKAKEKGIDIIMHIPMEAEYGKREWLGPNAITSELSIIEVKNRIIKGLNELEYCVGMNNHMGSKITQNNRIMRAILEIAKEKNLIFIDSKTTPKSVVKIEADKLGVISLNRDIFLDNIKSKSYIKNQLDKLGNIALKRGYAIGIGHVGVEGGTVTYEAIKEKINELNNKGIEFVTISKLVELVRNSTSSNQ